jgi:hypothetical protein
VCWSDDSKAEFLSRRYSRQGTLAWVRGDHIPFVSCMRSDFPVLAFHLASASKGRGQPIIILVRLNLPLCATCKAEASGGPHVV